MALSFINAIDSFSIESLRIYFIFNLMRLSKFTYAFIAGALCLGIYIITLAPTVGLIDSGELAMACAEPGIAHPTGYPLYTIMGRLMVIITGLEPVLATNLFSAICGAVAVGFFYLIVLLLADGFISNSDNAKYKLLAIIPAVLFGLSRTFWSHCTVTEVYTLEIAFDMIGLYLIMLWYYESDNRFLLGAAYIFGLSFGVHMITILFAPAILYFMIVKHNKLNLKTLFVALVIYNIGLTIYRYLPIRAIQAPFANFGDPSNWERYIRHISGWQYRVWMFSRTWADISSSLGDFGHQLIQELSPVSIVFALSGVYFLFRIDKRILTFFLLIFLADLIYSLNYSIPDIQAYFLPAIVVYLLFIAIAILKICDMIKMKWVAIIAISLIPATLIYNYKNCDSSNDRVAEEVALNIMTYAPYNAVVYLDAWDWYAPSVYIQQVRDYRKDLILLDFELMRRSWYLKQMMINRPLVFEKSKPEIEEFINEVQKFERDDKFDAQELEFKWRKMHRSITRENYQEGRIVCGTFYSGNAKEIWKTIPKRTRGLLQWVIPKDYPEKLFPIKALKLDEFEGRMEYLSRREMGTTSIYRFAFTDRAAFLYEKGKLERAARYLEQVVEYYPEYYMAFHRLAVIRIEQERYEEAIILFKRAEHIMPSGTKKEMIYNDLRNRIRIRDSLSAIGEVENEN